MNVPDLSQVDLSKANVMKCEKCENPTFKQTMMLHKMSALISPTGQEVIAPIQVFNCGSCGELLPLGGDIDELI